MGLRGGAQAPLIRKGISMSIIVISKDTNKRLSLNDVLNEVNRDRSGEWTDYNMDDLITAPDEVIAWIDRAYYDVFVI